MDMLSIIEYLNFIYILILDIRHKIISEKSAVLLLITGMCKSIINSNIEGYYLGICAYSMPLLILYIIGDYFEREMIGFGDIKLMMGIGGILTYRNLWEVVEFYQITYIFSGIAVVFIYPYFKYRGKKLRYIPFAPFIITGYMIFRIVFR